MSTYLLTWNPKHWDWDHYERIPPKTEGGNVYSRRWTTGNNESILGGDRVFLLRQGKDNPGLIASGIATSEVYKDDHWLEPQKTALYVMADWDLFLHLNDVLPRKRLLEGILPPTLVNTRVSGVEIDGPLAIRLEEAWAKHTERPWKVSTRARGVSAVREGETVEQKTYIRKRDRKLRDQAMDDSEGICAGCDVDFSKKLNGKALRVLQVHHKKQLGWSDKPRLTRASDLAVLCGNCHLLIHIDPKKAMSVQALKNWIKSSWELSGNK